MPKKNSYKMQQKTSQKRKARDIKRSQLRNQFPTGLGPIPLIEVSPAEEDLKTYIKLIVKPNPMLCNTVRKIRTQKHNNTRPKPSDRLLGVVDVPHVTTRSHLMDKVAALVDENLFGRSEMCLQFATLTAAVLNEIGIEAKAKSGQASYQHPNGTWFTWQHSWVEYDDCIIDGNVDTMRENPLVPEGIDPCPYWGPIEGMPTDRKFDSSGGILFSGDKDCDNWFLRLKKWIDDQGISNQAVLITDIINRT